MLFHSVQPVVRKEDRALSRDLLTLLKAKEKFDPNDVLKSGTRMFGESSSDTVHTGEAEGRHDSRHLPYCR